MKKIIDIEELKKFAAPVKEFLQDEKSDLEVNDTRMSYLTDDMVSENWQKLELARQYYESLADYRDRRKKSRKYLRGDQWHEYVTNEDGETVTEESYIKEQGRVPLKQNVIRQLMRSVVGQYRTNKSKTMVVARTKDNSVLSEMLTNTLQTAQYNNSTTELDARMAEEFFLSGMAIQKTMYSYLREKNTEDVLVKNINPNRIFFNTDIEDPRMYDLRIIGELIDVTIDDVISTFAKTVDDEQKIKSWYTNVDPKNIVLSKDGLTADILDNLDFYIPSETNKARVIEMWELVSEWRVYAHDYLDGTYTITKTSEEELEAINQERLAKGIENGIMPDQIPLIDYKKKKEQFWVVKFLTPYGQCLYQGETIYSHESHPYTLAAYPLLDGEVWGLVEDIIDQQRAINRMIGLIDSIMGTAAKGVLLVHEDAIPKDMSVDDFADEWTRFNGIIKFKGKPGTPLPQQVSANVTNIGAQDMLAMQLKMIQDISGVSGAIQGHDAKSSTPSSLYAQQALNSTTNTRDMFDVFAWFKRQRDTKMLKVIQQFYDEDRLVRVSGATFGNGVAYYRPDLAAGTDFDLVVTEGIDTPVFRQVMDDQLKALMEAGAIDIKMYLENSSLPFAEKLLESIHKREAQSATAQQGQMPPELMDQVNQEADPNAMNMLQQYIGSNKA